MFVEVEGKYPLETGGVLAGYCSADDKDIVITDIVGPGPNAIHERHSFTPDYECHKNEIGLIFDNSRGEISYLGDWHSHPDGHSYLSFRDKRALKNIANYPENYVDKPIMLVVQKRDSFLGEKWRFNIWRILRSENYMFWLPKWEYHPLDVRIF